MTNFLIVVHGLFALAWLAIMIIFWLDTLRGYAMNLNYVIWPDFLIFMAFLTMFVVECLTCLSLNGR